MICFCEKKKLFIFSRFSVLISHHIPVYTLLHNSTQHRVLTSQLVGFFHIMSKQKHKIPK
jgi:hypothetical protein